ncbi:MAG: TldD/PmbA family protein [bacterium]
MSDPSMSERTEHLLSCAAQVIDKAQALGADSTEVLLITQRELTTKVRLGEPELVQQAASRALGVRVMREGRAAVCHTADLSGPALDELAEQAVRLAGLCEPDPDAGPPDPADLAADLPLLDLHDPRVARLDADQALALAKEAEQAALDHDRRITNSEGASCSVSEGLRIFATSGGFCGHYRGTYASVVVEPIADDEGGKKRNGQWWDGRRHLARLAAPAEIGAEAARRTVEQLGARKVDTCQVPVIFSPEAGSQVLGTLFGVISGGAAYRNATYLLGRESTPIASELVTVVDDPLLSDGPGSRPFDGDGLMSRRNVVIDAGKFVGFLCDTYAGRRLGRPSTGSAGRGVSGPPGVTSTNFYLLPGEQDPNDLIQGTTKALYVTRLMGFGFNPVTGDFSKGAEGFWIEGGRRAFPVSEVTVSANLDDLLRSIDAVANDLDHRRSTSTPTFRVSQMTVAGS